MASYQIPPDPRKPDDEITGRRPRRQRADEREPIPWRWLGAGVLVTAVAIFAAVWLANRLLWREPLTAVPLPAPTVILLTAPPLPTVTATRPFPTPTVIPTFTPVPTPDVEVAPAEVTVGYYAAVTDTGGVGVTVRGGPSTNNVAILVAPEGDVLLVTDGPTEGSDRLWWQVRLGDGTEGWVAAEFLTPAPAPTP